MWSIMKLSGGLLSLLILQIFAGGTSGTEESESVHFNCVHRRCNTGEDCIRINGNLRCSDPCEHYTELDDDWRSTNSTSSRRHCDRDAAWRGWYRLFLGKTSAQIPDHCVDENRCGTNSPLWINGPHPTQSGVIVRANVCGSREGDCCTHGPFEIHVKLCHDSYYIYKLVRTPGCYLAYCAEESRIGMEDPTTTPRPQTTTTPLLDKETTIIKETTPVTTTTAAKPTTTVTTTTAAKPTTTVTSTTAAKPTTVAATTAAKPTTTVTTTTAAKPTTVAATTAAKPTTVAATTAAKPTTVAATTAAALPSQLMCEPDKLQIGLDLDRLTSSGLDPLSGNLASQNCSGARVRDNVVWYEVETVDGVCGNTLRTNRTHAIYSNSLFIYPVNNESFAVPVSLPFSCAYPLDTDTGLNVAIQPLLDLAGDISGSGDKALATMSLFHDSDYTDSYPAGRVTLPVGSPLYVGISVAGEDPSFAAVLEDCYATHSSNPDDPMRYPLIQNKCSTDRRQVSVTESGSSLQPRFSALLFLLQEEYRDIFLHCGLSLCDQRRSSCVPSCTRRMHRSVSSSDSVMPVSIGPIVWDE